MGMVPGGPWCLNGSADPWVSLLLVVVGESYTSLAGGPKLFMELQLQPDW